MLASHMRRAPFISPPNIVMSIPLLWWRKTESSVASNVFHAHAKKTASNSATAVLTSIGPVSSDSTLLEVGNSRNAEARRSVRKHCKTSSRDEGATLGIQRITYTGMSESSLPVGGHSCYSRLRHMESETRREKVLLHICTY